MTLVLLFAGALFEGVAFRLAAYHGRKAACVRIVRRGGLASAMEGRGFSVARTERRVLGAGLASSVCDVVAMVCLLAAGYLWGVGP